MSVASYVTVFLASLALTLISSLVLGQDLDRIARRLRFSEGLTGLLTALGADAPEISTAVIAIRQHHGDIGVGVVLGSNIFNLAGLLGLSALIAGRVRVGRHGLALDGAVSIMVTLIAIAMVFGLIPAGAAVLLLCAVIVPYVTLFSLSPPRVARLPLPREVHRFLDLAVVHIHQDARHDQVSLRAGWAEFLSVVPALASVVLGTYGMIYAAVPLGARWGVSTAVIGTLVLAALTSLPNVAMAVRLALHGRGAAVVSETLNSNTLNIFAGLCLPALFVPPLMKIAPDLRLISWWLLAMTAVAIGAAFVRRGLSRRGGSVVILMYVAFAILIARIH